MRRLNITNNRKMPFLQCIASGKKKAEGRVATELVRSFHVGDTLKLEGDGEYVICEITYLHFYVSFEEMLQKEGIENILPFVDSFAEGIKIYNSFPGAKCVTELGCCAIGVRCILSELNFELS